MEQLSTLVMTQNQIEISSKTLQELKRLFLEKNLDYTPLTVFFEKIGNQEKKRVSLRCNLHKDENGKNYEFIKSAYKNEVFSGTKLCPGCLSIIQKQNSNIPFDDLNKRLRESENGIVAENHYIIGYISKDDRRNNVVQLGCNVLNHNDPFSQIVTDIGKKNGCPECAKIRSPRKKAEDFKQEVEQKLKFYQLDQLFKYNVKIDRIKNKVIKRIKLNFTCNLCDNPIWADMSRIDRMSCKNCNPRKSLGERKIQNFLLSNKIKFETQKKYRDCKNYHSLPFDFYLPEYKILIEFDGKQHYEPIEYLGGVTQFFKTIKNDQIKNSYCEKNKISLLRIPYYDLDKIEYLITQFVNKISSFEKQYKAPFAPIYHAKVYLFP